MSGILIAFLLMLATVALTALLCRYRVKHHKPVGVGITLACGSAFPFLFYLFILLVSWGSTKAWHPFIYLGACCFIASICILPALGVVAYYQKRSSKIYDHVV
jgi:hypothetical protein